MASNDSDSKRLEKLVQKFRIEELKKLLETFKLRKSGTKPELMSRAIELLNSSPHPPGLERKIKQLYNGIPIKGWFPTKDNPHYKPLMKTFWAGRDALLGPSPSGSSSRSILTPRPSGCMSPVTADTSSPCTVGDVEPANPSPSFGLKMKGHPFHEVLSVIRKPTILDSTKQGDEVIFQFNLHQLHEILNPNGEINPQVAVLLRFCTSNSTTLELPDEFPEGLFVKVNGRNLVKIPAPEPVPNQPVPKRASYPVDIPSSNLSIHQANIVQLRWKPEPEKSYCCSIYLTKKISAETILAKLKAKSLQASEVTKDFIKKMTTKPVNGEVDGVDLCVPKSISLSLACPISKTRIRYPCRGVNCKHLQCFDAETFLKMNEEVKTKMPKFTCPVCNTHLKVNDLYLDGYFSDVLHELPVESANEIELFADGSWRPVSDAASEKRKSGCDKKLKVEPPPKKMKFTHNLGDDYGDGMNKTIDLDDEDSEDIVVLAADQVIQMPKTTITSTVQLPYISLHENPTRCYAASSGGVGEEPKCNSFIDSFKTGLGLGKENEIYLDLE